LTTDTLSDGTKKIGITSKYINDIFGSIQDFSIEKVTNKIFIKDSQFLQPDDVKVPIIMVGPGTGVVPFIGFM
jgi:sulfite reductase alpha subunit-like flavoprotein